LFASEDGHCRASRVRVESVLTPSFQKFSVHWQDMGNLPKAVGKALIFNPIPI
jgi:hypothetical protein